MAFKYEATVQHGVDTTEYVHLGTEGVSVTEFEGKKILKVSKEALTKVAEAAFYAKAYNEPEKLNDPIDGIGEFVTKRIMDIARKIIGMESKSVDFEPPGSAWYGRIAKRRDLENDPYGPFKNPLNHNYPKDLY